MKSLRRNSGLGLALTVLFSAAFAVGCGDDDPTGVPPVPPPPPANDILSGNIEAGETLTLDSSIEYLIQGVVRVEDGGTLIIPAGTVLKGDVSVQPTALLVLQGGRIEAVGTASDPIVFTSSAPVGSRQRGDWGGVVLNGRSICNFPADDCIGEGNSGQYGGNVLDDDSGILRYVRIEYVGFEVSFGNELNGLTLSGVGSGTQIDHIQSHYGLDDGIEFFGGTVDLKYALVTGASDDSFDYSTGWQGRGQFWIAQQDPFDADNGWEIDGNEEDFDATPFTDPLIYNVTLIGKGDSGAAGESTAGVLFRRGTAGDVFNMVIMGFEVGIDIDNAETAGRVTLQNSMLFDNATTFDGDDDGIDESAIVQTVAWNNVIGTDPGLTDPYNLASPDFRPVPGSAALSGFATPPSDGFFSAVDFIGGMDPDDDWTVGWTTTDDS